MPMLTALQCREHCNVIDAEQDAVLLAFLASAEDAAAAYLNRTIHADQAALDAAIAAYPQAVATARAAYDTSITAATLEPDKYKAAAMRDIASLKLSKELRSAEWAANGIVVNPSILAAVKLTLGHLYENRESVITGTIASEIPQGVSPILRPYRLVMMP